jgi:hypothetical protein
MLPVRLLCGYCDHTVDKWAVTLLWLGDAARLRPLFSTLLHLEPARSEGSAGIRIVVSAVDAEAARAYVERLLRRDGLAENVTITGVEHIES